MGREKQKNATRQSQQGEKKKTFGLCLENRVAAATRPTNYEHTKKMKMGPFVAPTKKIIYQHSFNLKKVKRCVVARSWVLSRSERWVTGMRYPGGCYQAHGLKSIAPRKGRPVYLGAALPCCRQSVLIMYRERGLLLPQESRSRRWSPPMRA